MAQKQQLGRQYLLASSTTATRWCHPSPLLTETRRHFSDRLLGFSPMAPSTPAPASVTKDAESKIPTAQDVSVTGGVWAPTSAKRDKLAELNIERTKEQDTLDDAATPEQLQDLYLADGIALIAKTVDSTRDTETATIQEFGKFLEASALKLPADIDEVRLEAHLAAINEELSRLMISLPANKLLREVRDFYDPKGVAEEELLKIKESELSLQDAAFDKAVVRFRLQLAQAAAEHLRVSWKTLTTLSDADVDRAATKGENIEREAKTLSLPKVHAVLMAHITGTCADRADAMWELLDRDADGLLDEHEMNQMAFLCLAPVQAALMNQFQDALDSYSVRAPPLEIGSNSDEVPVKKGWRKRRKEAKIKKKLLKLFQKTCKNHFDDEAEINHRLRCIYAWAEKVHQSNKLDSVLVEAGWSGRQRYVELSPKISLPEFREVQRVHFPHFDRVGAEILSSFREDLWVWQGKGRQDQTLLRECLLFLGVVSAIDIMIVMM